MLQVFLLSLLPLLGLEIPARAQAKVMAAGKCRDFDLRAAKPGFTCQSAKGGTFSLVHRHENGAEIWKDEGAGVYWGDKLPDRIRRRAARELCAADREGVTRVGPQPVQTLPTLKDFETAEKHGFREVLPNMKDHYYWIDSSVPGAKNIGHMFNGNVGKPEIVVYRSINFENVRCIGREANPK